MSDTNAITRKSLAAQFEEQDLIIEAANDIKRNAMVAYREQLAEEGWDKADVKAEAEAFRKAFARLRAVTKHGAEAVQDKDDRADAIYAEITSSAPRATRAIASSVPDQSGEVATATAGGESPPHPSTASANEGGENEDAASAELVNLDRRQQPDDGSQSGADLGGYQRQVTPETNHAPVESAADEISTPSNVTPIRKQWKHSDPAHPDCRNPGQCGGFSNSALCRPCAEAAASGQVA